MRISDWSSDVCSSDLASPHSTTCNVPSPKISRRIRHSRDGLSSSPTMNSRSEEHTSELQSLMRISYAVFCLKKKKYDTITSNSSIKQTSSERITNLQNTTIHV